MNKIIQFQNITKLYPGETLPALKGVSLAVEAGKFVVIVGPSGCGKTTLISVIAGLEQASSGVVQRPANVSMVFQNGALLPWLTLRQNIELVLEAKHVAPKQIDATVKHYIDMVGLSEYEHKYPRDLSGGQRQRVGLARALAVDPAVLVLDEPFSALDIQTTESLHRDILKIWGATRQTIVMVSHSIEEAVTLADEVVLMERGHIKATYDLTNIPRPRREQATDFIREVQKVRQALLDG